MLKMLIQMRLVILKLIHLTIQMLIQTLTMRLKVSLNHLVIEMLSHSPMLILKQILCLKLISKLTHSLSHLWSHDLIQKLKMKQRLNHLWIPTENHLSNQIDSLNRWENRVLKLKSMSKGWQSHWRNRGLIQRVMTIQRLNHLSKLTGKHLSKLIDSLNRWENRVLKLKSMLKDWKTQTLTHVLKQTLNLIQRLNHL